MTRLALIRHGHTAWNRAGRIQGRTDVPLDTAAETHLSRLTLPPPWDNAALVSSPLSRAVRTGVLISGKNPLHEPALMEMNWGVWEGKHGENLIADPATGYKHIEEWGWQFRPPEGESPQDVLARVSPWLDHLAKDTVAVCHIGIMRVILARATGWNFAGPAPFRIKRDRLFILEKGDTGWHLLPDPVRLVERAP